MLLSIAVYSVFDILSNGQSRSKELVASVIDVTRCTASPVCQHGIPEHNFVLKKCKHSI